MDLHLAGQSAVVVGAAQGIGLAIAREFAQEGAHVALIDRDEAVRESARTLNGNSRALAVVADVTDLDALQQGVKTIQAELKRIDHVVFAVGIGSGKFGFPFWNLEPTDWPRVLHVNVTGAVNVAMCSARSWSRRGEGVCSFCRVWRDRSAHRRIRHTAPPRLL